MASFLERIPLSRSEFLDHQEACARQAYNDGDAKLATSTSIHMTCRFMRSCGFDPAIIKERFDKIFQKILPYLTDREEVELSLSSMNIRVTVLKDVILSSGECFFCDYQKAGPRSFTIENDQGFITVNENQAHKIIKHGFFGFRDNMVDPQVLAQIVNSATLI